MAEAKLTHEETVQELKELIHDYPGYIPSAARRGLTDARAALEELMEMMKQRDAAQEETVPLEPLCRWLSHYAICPTKCGEGLPTNIEINRVGWEKWFRVYFPEWMKRGQHE